ncbi:unnamed protein product, partial [Prorocentrum cordatum]
EYTMHGDIVTREFLSDLGCPGHRAWLNLALLGLNMMYGRYDPSRRVTCASAVAATPASRAQCRAIELLLRKVKYFIKLGSTVPDLDGDHVLKSARIAYDGSLVERAQRLSWTQMLPALPSAQHCASIPSEEFAEGPTKEFSEKPQLCLKDVSDLARPPKAGALLIQPGEDLVIAKELLTRGLCVALEADEWIKVGDGYLLNGVFGVSKGTVVGEEGGRWAGRDVLRCIMNLTASNGVQELSSWAPLFAFDWCYDAHQLGLKGSGKRWLASTTLPMGWKSAMGVVQHPHRRLLMRRALWQVYADDFDMPELFYNQVHLEAGRAAGPHVFYKATQERYRLEHIPTSSDKAGDREQVAKRLGALIDGHAGIIGPDGDRVARLLGMTQFVLSRSHCRAKVLQVLGGHWTHIFQFRREASSLLVHFWPLLRRALQKGSVELCPLVRNELHLCMFVLPLTAFNLRAPIVSTLTASDACEDGGGVCATRGLTPYGVTAVARDIVLQSRGPFDKVGLVELCGGIGGARQALHLLGVTPAMYAYSEIDEAAIRVVKSQWPDVVELGQVGLISDTVLAPLRRRFGGIELLIVAVGSPCQDPQGLRSSLSGQVVAAMQAIQETFTSCRVARLTENIQCMSEESREAFTALLGTQPLALCPGKAGPVRRPKYFWCDWRISACHLSHFVDEPWGMVDCVEALWPASTAQLEPGAARPECEGQPFASFSRATKRRTPPPHPEGLDGCDEATVERWRVDQYRYSPWQYTEANCVRSKGARAPGTGTLRTLVANERESMMGYPKGYTPRALRQNDKGKAKLLEDTRCALIGNSFHAPSVAWLLESLLHEENYVVARPDFACCWGVLPKEQLAASLAREGVVPTKEAMEQEAVALLHRSAMFKGSDVRLAGQNVLNPGLWPRKDISPDR